MTITTTGVAITEVGQSRKYDLALGYSTDGTTAVMFGYTISLGTELQEATDIQDAEHLTQVASPSSTDRWDRYPRVSQGSWTGGGRQEVFVDPTRYWDTGGYLNVSQPGDLHLLPNFTFPIVFPAGWVYQETGAQGAMPIATDSLRFYIGGSSPTVNVVSNSPLGNFTVGPDPTLEVTDIVPYPGGMLYSTFPASMWVQPLAGFGAVPTVLSNDFYDAYSFHSHSMDYFDGLVFYPSYGFGNQLRAIPVTSGLSAGSTVFTLPAGEYFITTICAYAGGIFFATGQPAGSGFTLESVLRTYTGTVNWVGKVNGQVVSSCNVGGTVYFLVRAPQPFVQTVQTYTLYALVSGTTITVVDDMRFLNSYFIPPNPTNVAGFPRMSWDGRFLYVACPGIPCQVYDISNPSASPFTLGYIGNNYNNANNASRGAHGAVMTTDAGFVEVGRDDLASGGAFQGYFNNKQNHTASDSLYTSNMDFSTPNTTKLFRSVEVELRDPLLGSASVTVSFQIDSQTTWTAAAFSYVTSNNVVVCVLPAGTKGSRIRLKITLTSPSGTQVGPHVRSYSVKATLGRVWKLTVDVPSRRSLHTHGEDDQNATAQDLLANIQNAYLSNAGRMVCFMPSAKTVSGAEQVNTVIQDYSFHQKLPGMRDDSLQGPDMEATVDLVLTEDV